MRRLVGAVALMTVILGTAACGRDDIAGQVKETDTLTVTETAAPTARQETPNARADTLCKTRGLAEGAQACVLTGETIDQDVVFDGRRVVKLVNVAVTGSVRIIASGPVTVVGSTVGGTLEIRSESTVTVRATTVRGTLEISSARTANLIRTNVRGALDCDAVDRATGAGNVVAGQATGVCADIA
ncbi:hypothetical protein JVX90_12810 [Gordonia sp. PDNC005]|uniref:hypothetical protein n=1 Tax=unclassified Gordonia (in: high G+C Gram-positive bacteria) TaxID=2657482 RepID=UPI0019666C53|nr:hypothetical protein [Gordonia sp. PDNC005]QRY61303.1 hypothetical protein JVX90_12810 [Gordonia sp. PDNC005]